MHIYVHISCSMCMHRACTVHAHIYASYVHVHVCIEGAIRLTYYGRAYKGQPSHYLLLTAYYLLLTAYCSLLTATCLLLPAYCLLLTTYC